MTDKLAYFKGWKDACYDVAGFLDHLADNSPPELKDITSQFRTIAESVRTKGDAGLAMAESFGETNQ